MIAGPAPEFLLARDPAPGVMPLVRAGKEKSHREAVLITFLVTLSGVVIAGVGSAFWAVVAGGAALFGQQYGQPCRAHLPAPAQTTTTSSALKNP